MPRPMGVKVAVVGGGSTYTPELVEGFVTAGRPAPRRRAGPARHRRRAPRRRRRPRRTDAAARRAGRAARPHRRPRRGDRGRRLRDRAAPGRRQPGAPAATRRSRSRFGCIGQETTGPGGFAKALRTVPVVLELAELTASRGAPGAWFVDFTNPTGLVTQALLDAGHRALGLCNVAIGFQRRFAERFGVEPERVQLEHVGLNHLTWERAGARRRRGPPARAPRTRARRARRGGRPAGRADPARSARSPLLPALLLPAPAKSSKSRPGRLRAEEVMEIEAGLLELYRDPPSPRSRSSSSSAAAPSTATPPPRSSPRCRPRPATRRS